MTTELGPPLAQTGRHPLSRSGLAKRLTPHRQAQPCPGSRQGRRSRALGPRHRLALAPRDPTPSPLRLLARTAPPSKAHTVPLPPVPMARRPQAALTQVLSAPALAGTARRPQAHSATCRPRRQAPSPCRRAMVPQARSGGRGPQTHRHAGRWRSCSGLPWSGSLAQLGAQLGTCGAGCRTLGAPPKTLRTSRVLRAQRHRAPRAPRPPTRRPPPPQRCPNGSP